MAYPDLEPRFPKLTFLQKIELANRLCYISALTVLVFLRRDLGYRLLNPLHVIFITGLLMAAASILGACHPEGGWDGLFYFAILALLFAVVQRVKRRREITRDIASHSYYIGTSIFDFRWLPAFLRRNRRISRRVDPIFCLTVGAVLVPLSAPLGCWIIFAGLCVHAYEETVRRNDFNVSLDMLDGVIASDAQGQTMDRFGGASDAQTLASRGIPTGIGPDIHSRVKQRKSNSSRP